MGKVITFLLVGNITYAHYFITYCIRIVHYVINYYTRIFGHCINHIRNLIDCKPKQNCKANINADFLRGYKMKEETNQRTIPYMQLHVRQLKK